MPKPPAGLTELLYGYAPATQSLALGARALVLSELAPCHEYVFKMRSKVVLLYGPTERVIADAVCSLGVFARHVTLTFHRGAQLPDPARILQGAGKIMRHVSWKSLADLDNADVRRLLREARKEAGMKRRRGAPADVVTRIKPASAARRPSGAWDLFGFGAKPR